MVVITHLTDVPGTVLRAECTVVNYTDRELTLIELIFSWEETANK